jgi:hypothetical protein
VHTRDGVSTKVLVSVLVSAICYTETTTCKKREGIMQKLNSFWVRYGTPRNLRLVYVLLTLVALAIAGGAPSGSGGGGAGGLLRAVIAP